jgi:hypothetical protein
VCVFISKLYSVSVVNVSEFFPELELCCVDLSHGEARYRLIAIYRAPGSNNMTRLLECLSTYSNVKLNCIIVGDMNCPSIDWNLLKAKVDGTHDELLNFTVTRGFSQVVQSATRADNLLDIVLTSEPLSMCNIDVIEPFGNSDHSQVVFSLFNDCTDVENDAVCKRYDWANADYHGMSDYISGVDWLSVLTTELTSDSLWAAFVAIIQVAIDTYVPIKSLSVDSGAKFNRWYPAAVKRAIVRKRCLWRKHRVNPDDPVIHAAYRKADRMYRLEVRKFEIKREQRVIERDNAGSFFRFVNSKLSCKRGLGALATDCGDVITGDQERANLLNTYFTSMCTSDNGTMPFCDRVAGLPVDTAIETIVFTPGLIKTAIKKLKLGGACGSDGLPPRLFKKLADSIAEPLSFMFTSFMSVGKVPEEWKHALVTPVYKAGSASNAANYRPISLTCVACKLMERVIVNETLCYLRKHSLLTKQQHGFLSGRSTTSNLLETLNDWTLTINDKNSVAVAYVDFKRAFDCVSHNKLLVKLRSYGFSGNLLSWIENFLTNRSQQTKVGCSLSDVTYLSSGVVQGSVIGPLLFVLFINDIASLFNDRKCVGKLFADDLKLYSTLETDADISYLQEKLTAVHDWSDRWQLGISYTKCNLMYVGRMRCNESLFLNANMLPIVDKVKDLGIVVDSNLTFTCHIDQIVARAFTRAGLIHKCFVSRDTASLTRAFTVYVRPLLEYGSPVWSPYHSGKIIQIERVQRRFTKRLPGLTNVSYQERLEQLGLESLEMRRLRQDLTFAYKIIFGLVDNSCTGFFIMSNSNNSTRGHGFKIYQRHCRVDSRKYFFAERIIKPWNCLPAKSEHFKSLATFKAFVKTVNLTKFVSLGF